MSGDHNLKSNLEHNVMQQAIEALEWASDRIAPESETDCNCPLCKALDALNAALAEKT
jgi:hypothetical protein